MVISIFIIAMITFQLRLDHQPKSAWIRRFDSFDRFEDHWRSTLATPLLVRWSYRNSTIVTDYSEMLCRTYLVNSPVSWSLCTTLPGPRHLSRATNSYNTSLDWRSFTSYFQALFLAYRSIQGSASPLSLDISLQWAQSRGVSIFVRPLSVFRVQSYMVRNRLTVDLRDPGLGLLSFRRKL